MTPHLLHKEFVRYLSEYPLKFLTHLMLSILVLVASTLALAETCGVCNDSYLQCAAGGTNLDTCARNMRSCQSACLGTGSSSDATSPSEKNPGNNPAIVGISFGLIFSLGIWALTAIASTPQGAYKGLLWLSGFSLAIVFALCLAFGITEQYPRYMSFAIFGYLFFALPFTIPIFFQRKRSQAAEQERANKQLRFKKVDDLVASNKIQNMDLYQISVAIDEPGNTRIAAALLRRREISCLDFDGRNQ